MLKNNDFSEPDGDQTDDQEKIKFDMNYESPVVLKQMYKNNLYVMVVHLYSLEDTELKQPVLSVIKIEKNFPLNGISKNNILLKNQPLSESLIYDNKMPKIDDYNLGFDES